MYEKPALPPRHPSIRGSDVTASGHAHWGRFGAEAEGSWFLAIEQEVAKSSPDKTAITECLRHLQTYAHLRAHQAVSRFISEMKAVQADEEILHTESIAAAQQLWSLPSETSYIVCARQSLAKLKPHKKFLDEIAILIDPRVKQNRDSTDAMIGNAFRLGRNFSVKDASEAQGNERAIAIMMDGRPLPVFRKAPEVVPELPEMRAEVENMIADLRAVVHGVPFDRERARHILRQLLPAVEHRGAVWTSAVIEAVGGDSIDALRERKKLLHLIRSDLEYSRGLSSKAEFDLRAASNTYPPTRSAAHFLRIDDIAKDDGKKKRRKKAGPSLPDLYTLVTDAFSSGVWKRLALADKNREAPAAVAYLNEFDLSSQTSEIVRTRLMGPQNDLPQAVPINTLDDFYRDVVSVLKTRIAPELAGRLRPVILTSNVDEGITIEFKSKDGMAAGVASVWIPGPAQTLNIRASWNDAVLISRYYEKVPVGTNGWYALDFSKTDPLLDPAAPNFVDPVKFLISRNTSMDPVREDGKPGSREVGSRTLLAAWMHLTNGGDVESHFDMKVRRDQYGAEYLKWTDYYTYTHHQISVEDDGTWTVRDDGHDFEGGKDPEHLIQFLDRRCLSMGRYSGR